MNSMHRIIYQRLTYLRCRSGHWRRRSMEPGPAWLLERSGRRSYRGFDAEPDRLRRGGDGDSRRRRRVGRRRRGPGGAGGGRGMVGEMRRRQTCGISISFKKIQEHKKWKKRKRLGSQSMALYMRACLYASPRTRDHIYFCMCAESENSENNR